MRENKSLNGRASATNFYIPFLNFFDPIQPPFNVNSQCLVSCELPCSWKAGWCLWVQRAQEKGNCQIAFPRLLKFVHPLLPTLSCHTHLSLEWPSRCPFLTCSEGEDLEESQMVSGALKEGREPLRNCRPGGCCQKRWIPGLCWLFMSSFPGAAGVGWIPCYCLIVLCF